MRGLPFASHDWLPDKTALAPAPAPGRWPTFSSSSASSSSPNQVVTQCYRTINAPIFGATNLFVMPSRDGRSCYSLEWNRRSQPLQRAAHKWKGNTEKKETFRLINSWACLCSPSTCNSFFLSCFPWHFAISVKTRRNAVKAMAPCTRREKISTIEIPDKIMSLVQDHLS